MANEDGLNLGERPRRLNSRMIFTPDRSVLYVSVPKTGCTSIKMVIGASIGLLKPKVLRRATRGGIHGKWKNREEPWGALTDDIRKEMLFGDATYRFTSVRNPFERSVSCYLNKIVTKDDTYLARQLKADGKTSMLSFLQFVREQPPLDRDVHCRVMTDLCFTDRISYDDIIRYETFELSLRSVMERLNISHFSIPVASASSKTDAGTKIHEVLGPAERDLIREIYRSDFEAFGYSMKLPVG